ncbi:MAG: FecR domain-containing protein [Acidobacteria bacterium]|nr:FecR domain-containing protein [Acidobacteriota bacterium]
MSEEPETPKPPRPGWEYWTTVSYRSVTLIAAALLIMGLSVFLLLRPGALDAVLAKLTSGGGERTGVQEAPQARFINLDGTVRLKKRDAVQWVNADYSVPLDPGDTVQTGPNGIARITFVDGTTYVVKPDTLIVIEQHQALENQTTKVAVQVASGAVDLSTGTWEAPGSTSEVRFENAVARMQQNTRAAIRQDPNANIHEITVSEGNAALRKGNQTIQVGPYERAGFTDPQGGLNKEKVIAPPKLMRPRNLEPIISTNPSEEVVRFEWGSVEQARSYHLRVSNSPLFTSVLLDRRLNATSFSARGLQPGEYYWTVNAVDAKSQESQQSEPNRFTLAEQAAAEQLLLVIDSMIQHGRVIEIVGRTEPGATVTINAEPVAYVGPDGRFKHFTSPLPSAGAHSITIVALNRRGEVVTRKKTVYVQ